MNDNYFMEDLIGSLERNIVMDRYDPLIGYKGELSAILTKNGIVRKDQVSDAVIEEIRDMLGEDVSGLFARFIHIYDFNRSKLREIKGYAGKKEQDVLAGLLRLPGVRLLRAELYWKSGVTLEVLAEKSTEEIRSMVRDYIQRENRVQIAPQPKEVNCHRAVAKMILHTDKNQDPLPKEEECGM